MKNTILEIGKSVPRIDACTKVTGREKYAADHYGRDLLWAGVKRAGIPHGKVKDIHMDDALRIPGVDGDR